MFLSLPETSPSAPDAPPMRRTDYNVIYIYPNEGKSAEKDVRHVLESRGGILHTAFHGVEAERPSLAPECGHLL